MNELISQICRAIVKDYDDGVVVYNEYPVTHLHELSCENIYTSMNILDDLSSHLHSLADRISDDVLDVQCLFNKHKTHIYLKLS